MFGVAVNYFGIKNYPLSVNLRLDKFLRNPLLKLLFRIAMKVKNEKLKNKLHKWVYAMIPVMQKV